MIGSLPHRRYNPLLREWVLVSPPRLGPPWLGRVEASAPAALVTYDPACYLCPGNARAGDSRNPPYTGTFVFDNDYPALVPGSDRDDVNDGGLLVARGEPGVCRVVCFSPRHDIALSRMPVEDLRAVVDVWTDQFVELGARPWVNHVQIFENRGAAMGASNLHPHCQIWANASVPDIPSREQAALAAYRDEKQSCLLCDYLSLERERGDRLVDGNDRFTALVPFWAVWPFEVLVLPHRHLAALDELSDEERTALADILRRVTTRYDSLFESSCPYSMGFHQRPTDGASHPESHLHAHFYPPVLRSADVHKFMVGYELLATPQRDITPEIAAARLREIRI